MSTSPEPSRTPSIRDRIAACFDRWGEFVIRHRGAVIAVMLAVSAALSSQLPRLQIDNSVETFLHASDPALLRYQDFRDQFGRDDLAVIAIRPPQVFDLDFLSTLRALHRDLENEVPFLDEVTSLVNARSTRGEGDELIVEDLMEEWPENAADLALLRERVFDNPLYLDTLISRDGRFTAVYVKPVTYAPEEDPAELLDGFEEEAAGASSAARGRTLTAHDDATLVQAVRRVMLRHQKPGVEMHFAGALVVEERLEDEMQADLARFLGLSVLAVVVVLYLVFRRVSGVILPLLTVALSLPSALGTMALVGIPLSLTTEILPSYLLTIGVCYTVHILAIFFQRLEDGSRPDEAVRYALSHSGLAVLMTGLTTAGGLASFAWADVAPVSHLGVVGPVGVGLAVLYSLVLLPALLVTVPLRARSISAKGANASLINSIVACGRFSARRPWLVVAISGVVLAVAAAGTFRLRFANDYMSWFPAHEPVRTATALFDRELHGVVTLEAIVETGRTNGVHEPALLQRFDDLAAKNQAVRHGELFIGKTVSLADVLKETHRALNENRPEFYTLPRDRKLVAQELLLFESSGTDDLEDFVDPVFSAARIRMKVPWADWMLYPEFLDEMKAHMESVLGEDVSVYLTGFSAVMARAAASFIGTMAKSYVLALLIITPLMIFLLGSLGRGLLSMLPNLAPILLTLGLMGWLDIPLDMSTMLIGGIILGLAVDDTIHFMHRFNRYTEEGRSPDDAVGETLRTTGAAMLFTSVVLTAGFLAFTLAYMVNVAAFGFLSSFATVAAFLADVTLAPALMILVTRRQPHPLSEVQEAAALADILDDRADPAG